jgi:mono/diheme cytochrome c family protein
MMKKVLKWLGLGAGSVASLALAALGVLHVISAQHIARVHAVEPAPLAIPADSASIERGRHVVRVIAKCQACHGSHFEGSVFLEDPMIGRISASNITPAGVVANYTDRDWIRAIRHGVKPDGRSTIIMPSYEFHPMSAEDLAASIAYLKTLEPVEHTPPAMRLGPMARMLIATGMFPILPADAIDHAAPFEPAPAAAATPEYGSYLASIGCVGCHGPTLQGAKPPATGPDITPRGRLAGWTEEDFRLMMRSGKRPDGTVVDTEMPWNLTAGMTDIELAAVWAYLQALAAGDGVAVHVR